DLVKIAIEESDRAEIFRRIQADNRVGFGMQLLDGFERRNGNRNHDLLRIPHANRSDGRKGRGSRGNPIIDDDRNIASDCGPRTTAEIALASSFDLGPLLLADGLEFLGTDAANFDHVTIAN